MKFLTAKIRETIKNAIAGNSQAQAEAQQILESEFSYGEKNKALYSALRSESDSDEGYVWRYIRDVYDTWLVYERYSEGAEQLYRADYAINDAGVATISNPQRVKITYELLPVEIKESARKRVQETTISARPAVEKAIGADGTMEICIIKAGSGSSGRYSREVLERDIPKIFPIGTHMYANHLSADEEINQPEGRIEFLAAETTTTPIWKDGHIGEGMYARSKPFQDWAPTLDDKARAIGVSINAFGIGEVVDGQLEFTQLTEGRSIDFVTKAGAGGAIVPIKEAKRPTILTEDQENIVKPEELTQLREAASRTEAVEAENKRLKEAEIKRTAKDEATAVLEAIDMPPQSRVKVAESVAPVLKEDGTLDVEAFKTAVTEAAGTELEYLQEATGYGDGGVRGNGGGAAQETAKGEATLPGVQAVRESMGMS